MECKYAYMKQNIDYVLCRKEPEPNRHDREKLFHSMCGHQVNCPKENCHKLTANWRNCVKLVEPAEEDPKPTQPKSRRGKKAEEE